MNAEPLSLVFTGHMIDLPGRSPPRFPPELVDAARIEIERRIARHTEGRSKSSVNGFASLARGGDILYHEICRNFGIDTVIVLPFSPDLFLKTSVEGAKGGNWAQRFRKLWDETPPARRYDLGLPQSDEPYAICNEHILELARQEGGVQLIALWDGGGGDGPGGTADLVARAKSQSDRLGQRRPQGQVALVLNADVFDTLAEDVVGYVAVDDAQATVDERPIVCADLGGAVGLREAARPHAGDRDRKPRHRNRLSPGAAAGHVAAGRRRPLGTRTYLTIHVRAFGVHSSFASDSPAFMRRDTLAKSS